MYFCWGGGQKAASPLSDPHPKYKQLIVISNEVRNLNNITLIKVYRTIVILNRINIKKVRDIEIMKSRIDLISNKIYINNCYKMS